MRLRLMALLFAPAAACVDDPNLSEPPVVDSGRYHHFAQTGWIIPATYGEGNSTGFDFDDNGEIDNQAGAVMGGLQAFGLDVLTANREAFASGDLVVLHSVRADSLVDDASASWRILSGLAVTPPRFDGTDQLIVAGESGLLSGSIDDGVLDASFGGVTLRVPFFRDQAPLLVPLVGARVEMTPTAEGCHGLIGGALDEATLDADVLPALAAQIVTHMDRNPEHEFTAVVHDIFDADADGVATATEIASAELTRSLFRLDLDRDRDGYRDSVSFALGFGCVPARFVAE